MREVKKKFSAEQQRKVVVFASQKSRPKPSPTFSPCPFSPPPPSVYHRRRRSRHQRTWQKKGEEGEEEEERLSRGTRCRDTSSPPKKEKRGGRRKRKRRSSKKKFRDHFLLSSSFFPASSPPPPSGIEFPFPFEPFLRSTFFLLPPLERGRKEAPFLPPSLLFLLFSYRRGSKGSFFLSLWLENID